MPRQHILNRLGLPRPKAGEAKVAPELGARLEAQPTAATGAAKAAAGF